MTTHGSQDGDQAIKNRERAFRFTSKASNGDLSEVEREMQTARYSSLEPINTMTNGVDAQHTNMHTSVVPNLSELYIESPQQQPMEPSKLDAGNKYSSSPSTDYAQSQATFVPKDMPPPRLNESSKPSHSESRSTANSNATNARYSGDELIKQRERGFRTTKVSNVSAVVGSMPVGGAEPVEPLGNVWDRATTSTNDNLIAAKISSSLEGTSSRRNGGEDIKMRERQFRAMTASNVLPKMDDDTITIHSVEPEPIESTMASSAEATWHAGVYSPRTNESISEVSQQIAPGKASGVRVHEDERMKARERQFRSTTRAVGVSREVSTKVNPSEHVAKSANVWGESTSAPANMLDKVATSPTGVLSNDVAVNQTVPGQQFRSVVVPGVSAEMDNANVDILEPGAEQLIPSVSLSANPWAHSSSAPGSVAKVASARELEDAGIKARVHQFRSRRVPHISSVVETASTSDPVGPTDDETVFSESACTHSTEQASVTDSIGTARSGDRLKARMRQFRTRNAINASGVLSKLQSYESTITDVKSRAQKNALASGVGAYAVEMQGDTATFSHRGLSVVSTTSRNAAADLGVKGRVRVRKHKSKLDGKVSSVTGCPPGNTAPHEDSVDSTSLPEKGAVRMYTGGIAVQTSRGTLTPHPVVEDISVEPLAMDETRDVEEPRTVDTSANVDETVKGEQAPRSKTRTILGVCALIIVVGAIVGAVVAMSGATDKTGGTTPDVVAMSPTRSPTESPINLERMSIVRSHILNGLSTAEVLDDETSPQYAALLWITNNDKLSLIGEESSVDEIQYLLVRFVLASVYYSLDGNAWLSKRGWLDGGEDHCHWEYISCDDTTLVVTGIKTDGPANMKGSIPSEILHLTSLAFLNLGGNAITAIPEFDNRLSNMSILILDDNPIGNAPSINKLTNLEFLSLQRTGMTGNLDISFNMLSNLRSLYLGENSLDGSLSSEFHQMTNLVDLRLQDNMFEGDIDVIFRGIDNLHSIDISQNRFHGQLGGNFVNLTLLENVELSRNMLSGSLPPELFQISNLKNLDLTANFDIGGSIPSEIGLLHETLVELRLGSTGLGGPIPSELWQLTKLENLYMISTFLSGTLPQENCGLHALKEIRYDCIMFQCDCPDVCAGGCDN